MTVPSEKYFRLTSIQMQGPSRMTRAHDIVEPEYLLPEGHLKRLSACSGGQSVC